MLGHTCCLTGRWNLDCPVPTCGGNQHDRIGAHIVRCMWAWVLSHDRFRALKLRYVGIAHVYFEYGGVFPRRQSNFQQRYTCWKTCRWVEDGCIHTYSILLFGLSRPKKGKQSKTPPNLVRISWMMTIWKKDMGIYSDIFEEGAGGAVVAIESMRRAVCRTGPLITAITRMRGYFLQLP